MLNILVVKFHNNYLCLNIITYLSKNIGFVEYTFHFYSPWSLDKVSTSRPYPVCCVDSVKEPHNIEPVTWSVYSDTSFSHFQNKQFLPPQRALSVSRRPAKLLVFDQVTKSPGLQPGGKNVNIQYVPKNLISNGAPAKITIPALIRLLFTKPKRKVFHVRCFHDGVSFVD